MKAEFVGYDKDNERVWRTPIGKYFMALDQEEADSWLRPGTMQVTGFPPETYEARYGPITKEKS